MLCWIKSIKINDAREKYTRQDRSHQWSTRPAHSPGRQWLSLDFEVLGRTYGRKDTLCENSDYYRPGLWSASWINRRAKLQWNDDCWYQDCKIRIAFSLLSRYKMTRHCTGLQGVSGSIGGYSHSCIITQGIFDFNCHAILYFLKLNVVFYFHLEVT